MSYVSVQGLRILLNKKSNNSDEDDARVLVLAESVSDYIDKFCSRSFRIKSGARSFAPEWQDKVVVDDLLSVTSITTDLDGDGTFETTWAATDYFLTPLNATDNERPYTAIHRSPNGAEYIPHHGVFWPAFKVTGKWGFWEDLIPTTQLNGALNASVTSVVCDDALEVGWTILVDSEQMYVQSRDTVGTTGTVVRGYNGTTAASHLDNAAVSIYAYPPAIVQAATLHAARIWRRKETPTGIINTPGDIGWRAVYIPRFDADTQAFLQPYRRRRVM